MKKFALILVAVAAFASAFLLSSRDAKAKEPIEAASQKIKELQKERIATLEKLVEQLTALAQSGQAEVGEVLEARQQLLQAQLDAAEKAAERIAIYEKVIASLQKSEELAQQMVMSGRGTTASMLKFKARRLEVQIALEQEKAKEGK